MLKYEEVYRTEADNEQYSFPALLGAAPVSDGRWVFFIWNADGYASPTVEMDLQNLKDVGGGVVAATIPTGDTQTTVRFIPVRTDYIRQHPDLYPMPSEMLAMLDGPGMLEAYFQVYLPPEYESLHAPASSEAVESAPAPAVQEARTGDAPGTVRLAKNGGFYEKQPDGAWVKIDWFP